MHVCMYITWNVAQSHQVHFEMLMAMCLSIYPKPRTLVASDKWICLSRRCVFFIWWTAWGGTSLSWHWHDALKQFLSSLKKKRYFKNRRLAKQLENEIFAFADNTDTEPDIVVPPEEGDVPWPCQLAQLKHI